MGQEKKENLFLNALQGQARGRIPFWFMRQAGRYLPEYREIRKTKGGFLDMAYDARAAAEITVQPVRRFGMDAAIIFSDILVIPDGLGQPVRFEEGHGPKLAPLENLSNFSFLKPELARRVFDHTAQVITETRNMLNREGLGYTAIIGFAGAPWTLACYMVEGGGSKDFHKARLAAYQDPAGFTRLIDLLTTVTADYLIAQGKAGAQTLQLFDSWAGVLEAHQFHRWVIHPAKTIIARVKAQCPDIPIIGFPKGAGSQYLAYARDTGVHAVSIDYHVPTSWAARSLQPLMPVQGNLDPLALLAGEDALKLAFEKIVADLAGGAFIFNLGHGIHKDTPVEHVERLVQMITEHQR